MSTPRTPKLVIDQAIRENKLPERMSYTFACVFVGMGVVSFGWLMFQWQPLLTIVTVISNALFWPAMREAREIRNQNIAIRLMEVPLSRAENEKSAADLLEKFFSTELGINRG